MKNLLYIVLLVVFASCSESIPKTDFARSNWGDSFQQISEVYKNEPEFKQMPDMISYQIQSLKDTATVNFIFADKKLVSGFVKYNVKSAKDTKKLYDAYVRTNREKFGLETFMGNPQIYDNKEIEQKVWQDEFTLVSILLDNYQLEIKFYDKQKMPKN